MIKKNQRLMNTANILLDMLIVFGSYILASHLWLDVYRGNTNMARWQNSSVLLLDLVFSLIYILIAAIMGMYNTTRVYRLRRRMAYIVSANTLTLVIATAVLYVFRLQDFSRGVLALFYIFSMSLLCLKYVAVARIFEYIRGRGYNIKHVLVLGTGHLAQQYANDIKNQPKLGFHLKGYVGERNDAVKDEVLCGFAQLDQKLMDTDIDEVVIALDAEELGLIRQLIALCEKNGLHYAIIPFYNDIISEHPGIVSVGASKLLTPRRNVLDNRGYAMMKRMFDVAVSVVLAVILSPVMLLVALGVKLSSPGPVLFKQERIGYRRKPFTILKFRSMRVNDRQDTAWTTDTDPRKTAFGSLIRKCSLDELPQLFNVIKGDMSLIGPRPELEKYVILFRETIPFYMLKHQVRPGITGWAQVNGYRGDTDIAKRIEYDIWYIENWTVWLDIKILLKTVFGGMVNREHLYAKVEQKDKGQQA